MFADCDDWFEAQLLSLRLGPGSAAAPLSSAAKTSVSPTETPSQTVSLTDPELIQSLMELMKVCALAPGIGGRVLWVVALHASSCNFMVFG